MRRRLAVLLFAALVVLSAVPANAAEPDPTPVGTPAAEVTPEPSPATEPTPEPTATAQPTTDPPPTSTTEDPAPTPSASEAAPAASPSAPAAPDPSASPAPDPSANGGLDVTGEYIVVLKSGSDTAAVAGRHQIRDGIRVGRRFSKVARAFTARLDRAQRAALRRDPSVAAIVPDEIVHITAQTVPKGVARIGGRASTIASIDGSDQRVDADVAIVDTGIGPHPDLNIAGGYNCSSSDRSAWSDANGHGTHVAGTVAALDNSFGVVGVAPGARLWAVRILNADGYGKLSWYVCGLDWILAQRDPNDSSRPLFEAVNMSVAKDGADDKDCGNTNKDILHQAICRLVAGGITVVAAAANDHGSASHRVPAAYNEVITVSALADTDGKPGGTGGNLCYSWGSYDKDDTFANFSNYGHDIDLIAPGKCIWSTKPGPTYGYSSGTSMAAPAVTGAVALYKASRPNATPREVKEALQYLGNLSWKTSTDPDSYHEKLLDVSRLGTLGTFNVSAGSGPLLGESGGTTSLPVTLTRSGTFFERVGFAVTSLPAGWTASWASSSLLGWTADSNTLTVTAPDPVRAGSYAIGIATTNQGRTRSTTATVVVENDKPTAHPATSRMRSTAMGRTSAPVTFSWPAATDPSSAIGGYEIGFRTVGGEWGTAIALGPTTRSVTRYLTVGATYEARVRAKDRVGNWSPWVVSTPTGVSIVDDRSKSIDYSPSWRRTSSGSAWRDSLHRSASLGARITYRFTGRAISVVAPTGPGRAKVAVYIDGKLMKVVNLRRKSTHTRDIVYTATFGSSGSHRITLKIVTWGKVQLDAFLVGR